MNTNFELIEEEKKSEYHSHKSLIGYENDQQSVGTFQNDFRPFRGIEQSEICKLGHADSENTSTIRWALHQVTKLVNAHDLRFYENNDYESEISKDSNVKDY